MSDHYDELKGMVLSGAGFTSPFRPYVGSAYEEAEHPRSMFCGKATNGWHDGDYTGPDWSEGEAEWAKAFIDDSIKPKTFDSAFWRFITDTGSRLLELDDATTPSGDDRMTLLDKIIWTNVAKIGGRTGNLPDNFMSSYKDIFERMLTEELLAHDPDVLILTTGWYGYEAWWPALEKWTKQDPEDWLEESDLNGVVRRHVPDFGKQVWVLRHPQYWAHKHRDAAINAIVDANRARAVTGG